MKRIADLTVAEYQRLAKRMDRRFAADQPWANLPVRHTPGRPRRGEARDRLQVHSIKMTTDEWAALQCEAKALGMTVNALVRSVLRPAALPRVIHVAGLSA